MKEHIKYWKKYENKPTDKNLVNFLGAATNEYIKKICGVNACWNCIGIEDFDDLARKDIKFREWFKKEFYYWLKFEDNNLIMIDTRLNGLKYKYP